ncbi:MT-A70-domain-containing protein [Lophiostoma macrostomum CBS 122681]|uniref:MT-A70-domain-containing protein n=1 Tax=Lophiostoma macrostomum CBS 122681 TaxID=1314788 RepID=A0A6A6TQR9_9PLEO|nr:MT-A70-domain-containing protein [Lophiostoma macrostomum CBS 122681]
MEDPEESLGKLSLQSAILYQNSECNITLIDIPTSIALAQGSHDILRSTEPLEEPILIDNHVPKTPKAKETVAKETDPPLHFEYKVDIEAALVKILANVRGPWCLPRNIVNEVPSHTESGMQIEDEEQILVTRLKEWRASKGVEEVFDFDKMMATLGATSETNATSINSVAHPWLMSCRPAREVAGRSQVDGSVSPKEPWTSSFHNPERHALDLTIFDNQDPRSTPEAFTFRIPSRSSFFLCDTEHSEEFRASFRTVTEDYTLPRHFDFVLLDPPWPNGSVKRKGNYEQVGGMPHMRRMLMSANIDSYLEHNGLVGIWITNKKSLRDLVLGPGGLFETWNVGLIEEWIWIKTTTKGAPMFDLDSSWRKPYETLLLGRAAPNAWTKPEVPPVAKRRVIAAVPDNHSRKPCLKALIEPYMPDSNDYSALEIFSRYLVAGWTSWGNEVIKYNWDRYWASSS